MNDQILSLFKDALTADQLLTGRDLESRFTHIWKMNEPLQARAVLLPRTTEDVASILKICNENGQKVTVHGGLTGLTGATETQPNDVVISLEKMNDIEEIDQRGRTLTVQAGVILENVQRTAAEHDLLFPLNFGAKGSAQIGGIISTNAGGLRVFKFGMTRNLILGLEAVLADGTIISSMNKIIKDNSGYDVKQLFIGSEGTLGIVTRAVLKLVEAPESRVSAFVGVNSYEQVIQLLKFMDKGLAGALSGFELIWNTCFRAMTSPPALVKPPLPYDYKYYVLLESLGSHQEKDQEKLENLLGAAMGKGIIEDAAIASNQSDLNWFWTIREDVHVFVSKFEYSQHFDVSLPIPYIGNVVDRVLEELNSEAEVLDAYAFGHVADGNIHFIVGKKNSTQKLTDRIDEIVYAPLRPIKGSVSAEHGIGLNKKKYLTVSKSAAEIALMKSIKLSLDPNVILNPGRIFDV